jgi:hypothetical protein
MVLQETIDFPKERERETKRELEQVIEMQFASFSFSVEMSQKNMWDVTR